MDTIEAKSLVRRYCPDLTAEQQQAVFAALRARKDIRTGRRVIAEVRADLGLEVK